MATSLATGEFDDRQLACGHLALAMIADKALQQEAAEKHYQAALPLLDRLSRREMEDARYQQALARCQTELARLKANDHREEAKALLQQALLIYKELAEQHSEQGEYWVDWMESELQHAVMGIGDTLVHTTRGRDLERRLRSTWPSDPVEMYKVASYLTRQSPILLDSAIPAAKQ